MQHGDGERLTEARCSGQDARRGDRARSADKDQTNQPTSNNEDQAERMLLKRLRTHQEATLLSWLLLYCDDEHWSCRSRTDQEHASNSIQYAIQKQTRRIQQQTYAARAARAIARATEALGQRIGPSDAPVVGRLHNNIMECELRTKARRERVLRVEVPCR